MLQNSKQKLGKLSKTDALDVLQHWPGVASAKIQLSTGTTMPDNVNDITLTLQTLPGATPPPGPGTPGSGTPGTSGPSGGSGTPGSSGTPAPGPRTAQPGGSSSP